MSPIYSSLGTSARWDPRGGRHLVPVVRFSDPRALERLVVDPRALAGWYDPARGFGEVDFPTMDAAQAARQELL